MEDMIRNSEGYIELKRTYSELYKKVNYTADVQYVVDHIYEYDIRSANTSALRASKLIDPKILTMLEGLNKQAREETIGKMIRREKQSKKNTIYKAIADGIQSAKEKLFRLNHIQDRDVLAIKNDAVFMIGRKLKYTKFGPFEFRPKHTYMGYMNIDKIELYYDKRNKSITIKGIRDEVVEDPDHQKGMIQFFLQVFKYLAMDQRSELRQFLVQFVRDYKSKKLPHYYYKELNGENIYRTVYEIAGFEYNLLEIGEKDLDIINPVYNYTRYILPIIRMFM